MKCGDTPPAGTLVGTSQAKGVAVTSDGKCFNVADNSNNTTDKYDAIAVTH